jgi:integrase/recombinase XerD
MEKITSEEMLEWLERSWSGSDKSKKDRYFCTHCIRDILDTQLDRILKHNGAPAMIGKDIPDKISEIEKRGYATSDALKNINKIRNKLPHGAVLVSYDVDSYISHIKDFVVLSNTQMKVTPVADRLTNDKIISEYSMYLKNKGASATTISIYTRRNKQLLVHTRKHFESIKSDDIDAHLLYLQEKARSKKSVSQFKSAVVSFYNEFLQRNLKIKVKIKVDNERKQAPLNKLYINRLFKQADSDVFLYAGLIYGSGLTQSEIIRLKKDDINFSRRISYISLENSNKVKPIIVADILRPKLKKYSEPHQKYLFEYRKNKPASSRILQKKLKSVVKKAGVPDVTATSLRFSFIQYILEAKLDSDVKIMLTSKAYIGRKISEQELQRISSPLDKLKL